MAAFDALIARGKAILEDRNPPKLRVSGAAPAKRWTIEALKDEARHNPRVQVAIYVGGQLVPVRYEGPRPDAPQKGKNMSKGKVSATLCGACGLVGAGVIDGKIQPHKDRNGQACDGVKRAPVAPRAFVPKCQTGKPGLSCKCRACGVARGVVDLVIWAAEQGDTRQPLAAAAAPAIVQTAPAPIPASIPPQLPIAPHSVVRPAIMPMDRQALLAACVDVATGIVGGFQAIRDAVHASEVADMLRAHKAQATMTANAVQKAADLALQLDAARAGHAVQVAKLHNTTAPAAHACYRCKKEARMGYILDGQTVCRDCRGAHREAYYASKGRTAPPRTDRRARRVEVVNVTAERVNVAAAS